MNQAGNALLRAVQSSPFTNAMLDSYRRVKGEGLRVLDYGCGYGWGSHLLVGRAAEIVGYDPNPGRLAQAKACFVAQNLAFVATPREIEGFFDAVCLFQVLGQLEQPAETLAKAAAFVKPGGRLYASTKASCKGAVAALEAFAAEYRGTVKIYPLSDCDKLLEWETQIGGWYGEQAAD